MPSLRIFPPPPGLGIIRSRTGIGRRNGHHYRESASRSDCLGGHQGQSLGSQPEGLERHAVVRLERSAKAPPIHRVAKLAIERGSPAAAVSTSPAVSGTPKASGGQIRNAGESTGAIVFRRSTQQQGSRLVTPRSQIHQPEPSRWTTLYAQSHDSKIDRRILNPADPVVSVRRNAAVRRTAENTCSVGTDGAR